MYRVSKKVDIGRICSLVPKHSDVWVDLCVITNEAFEYPSPLVANYSAQSARPCVEGPEGKQVWV